MLSHVIWAREALIKSLSAKTVLLVLASHADKENKAFPGIPLLARECSLTERGVMKAIQTLTQGDPPLLAVERQLGKHNLYRLLMTESPTQEAHKQEDTPERSSPLNVVHPVTEFTPPLNVVHPTPERSSLVPLNVVHPKGKGKNNEGQGKEIDACASAPAQPSFIPEAPKQRSRSEKAADKDLSSIILPDWMPEETWHKYVVHRKSIKKPMSVNSAETLIEQLNVARENGWSPEDLMNSAISSGYQGCVYDKHKLPKPNQATQFKPGTINGNRKPTPAERHNQCGLAYAARIRRENEALEASRVERDVTNLGHRVM